MQPSKITKTKNNSLQLRWDNGHLSEFPLNLLRNECPCAQCKGETLLLGKTYKPMKLPLFTPGMFDLKKINLVGNYAIQLSWGDNHDTGIYSWSYLLELESKQLTNTENNGQKP